LGHVRIIKGFGCLQFNNDFSLNQQIRSKFAHYRTVIFNLDARLMPCLQSAFSKLMSQGVFVDFFQKTASQGIANFINAADDFFGNDI
jgi:hypothetical protein